MNRGALVYQDDGRRMHIAGEMLMGGFRIARASIVTWDDSNGELITADDRQRIIDSLRLLFDKAHQQLILD
jgi:hypothetical protein